MTEQQDWQTVRDELTPELRRTISWAFHGCCVICGSADQPHVDHIVPVSLGGQSQPENLWILCAEHNRQKGAQWPTFWLRSMLEHRDEIRKHNDQRRYDPKLKPKPNIMWHSRWKYDDGNRPLFVQLIDAAIEATLGDVESIPKPATTASLDHRFDGYEPNP